MFSTLVVERKITQTVRVTLDVRRIKLWSYVKGITFVRHRILREFHYRQRCTKPVVCAFNLSNNISPDIIISCECRQHLNKKNLVFLGSSVVLRILGNIMGNDYLIVREDIFYGCLFKLSQCLTYKLSLWLSSRKIFCNPGKLSILILSVLMKKGVFQ